MPNLAINQADIYYSESGTGIPLVLVHGTGECALTWEAVLPFLTSHFRVITYDRRGHQRSSGPVPPSSDYHAQNGRDLIDLLDRLKAVPAVVVGWSAGAFAVFHAALEAPDKFKQLILYEPPLHAKKHLTLPLIKTFARVALLKLIRRPDDAANAFRRMVTAYSDGGSTPFMLSKAALESRSRDVDILLRELEAGTCEELSRERLSAEIAIPVNLITGERTPRLFSSAIKRLQTIFPAAHTYKVQGANHFAHIELPEAFANAIISVVQRG